MSCKWIFVMFIIQLGRDIYGKDVYVDDGNPYTDHPVKVGELTLTPDGQNSPLHTKVHFPLESGQYPAVVFVGGLNGLVIVEVYSTILQRIASHGFFVFGLDYRYPVETLESGGKKLKQDISKFFDEITFLQTFMENKTDATIVWNNTGVVCHSSGCDVTLKMVREKQHLFKSTIFLEPVSFAIIENIPVMIPALMYGTQLSTVGNKCVIPGFSYNKFYDVWNCPKIVMEVADFGHCDMLDTVAWSGCKAIHFCTVTKNTTKLPEYHEFVQGVVSSFLVSSLQGRTDAMKYVTNRFLIPMPLVELKTDLNCH